MSIINIFDTDKELFHSYPKKFYWNLKDIFNDYWFDFLDFASSRNLNIRDVVFRDVNRMISCKTPSLGFSSFKCPNCGEEKIVYNTCKSRFCNSCGIKYSKQRADYIESKLIAGEHRHIVFTISNSLWPLFLENRKRLNYMFEAASKTLLSWYKNQYKLLNLKPGFILTLHTFGRDDKWNVHIHCLLSKFEEKSGSFRLVTTIAWSILLTGGLINSFFLGSIFSIILVFSLNSTKSPTSGFIF